MADQGYTAENKKPAWLQEVEDDATYITQKRFDEHFEERKREADKAERNAQKASQTEKKGNE